MDNTDKLKDWEEKALKAISEKEMIQAREKKRPISPADDQMGVLYNFTTGQIQKVTGDPILILGRNQITEEILYRNADELILPDDFYLVNRYRQLLPRIIHNPDFPLHEGLDYYQIIFRLNTNPLQSVRRKCYLFRQGLDLILYDIWEKIQPIEYVQASFFHTSKQKEINRLWYQLNLATLPFITDLDLKLLYYFDLDCLEKEIAGFLSVNAKKVDNRKTRLFEYFNREIEKMKEAQVNETAKFRPNKLNEHRPINSRVKLVQAAKQFGVLPINDNFLAEHI